MVKTSFLADKPINRIGFGAMQLAGPGVFGPPRDPDAARAVLHRAIELGVDHIDTAQYYGPDVVNDLIRETLHPYPEHLKLVTKVGARRDEAGGWLPAASPAELRADVAGDSRARHERRKSRSSSRRDGEETTSMAGPVIDGSARHRAFCQVGSGDRKEINFHMQITRSSIDTAKGPEEWFTGDVYIDAVAAAPAPGRAQANLVHFTPGARTAWHTHPLGQTIHVTEGVGLCQRHGGPIEVIRPGDSVFFEPDEDHWHGAAPRRFMVHLALNEVDDDHPAADWGEQVTDEEYAAAPAKSD